MKIAVCIASLIRCHDINKKKFSFLDDDMVDVFVYTNVAYKSYVKVLPNVRVCRFVEESKDDKKMEKNIRHNNQHQWFKLYNCFKLVEWYSMENNINYDIVMKVRTDLTSYPDRLREEWFHDVKDGELYTIEDQNFYGKITTFRIVHNFFGYLSMYDTRHDIYVPLNYETLLQSNTRILTWLNYPSSIISKGDMSNIKKTVGDNICKLNNINKLSPDKLKNIKTVTGKRFKLEFSSTKSFILHVINNGVVVLKPVVPFGGLVKIRKRYDKAFRKKR